MMGHLATLREQLTSIEETMTILENRIKEYQKAIEDYHNKLYSLATEIDLWEKNKSGFLEDLAGCDRISQVFLEKERDYLRFLRILHPEIRHAGTKRKREECEREIQDDFKVYRKNLMPLYEKKLQMEKTALEGYEACEDKINAKRLVSIRTRAEKQAKEKALIRSKERLVELKLRYEEKLAEYRDIQKAIPLAEAVLETMGSLPESVPNTANMGPRA
ncbi:MAG: hypothetical protein K0R12_746 [Gammaproteobacteria bacterium]|nr:hypothetical protein [Gammaproteobacteria bacterium]